MHIFLIPALALVLSGLTCVCADDPYAAMKNPHNLQFKLDNMFGSDLNGSTVDGYELNAAKRALHNFNKVQNKNTNESDIDGYDLDTARHYLYDLKTSLYADIPRLIDGEVKEADRVMSECYEKSNGKYKGTTVFINITGDVSLELLKKLPTPNESGPSDSALLLKRDLTKSISEDLLYQMHPEHYYVTDPIGVVETWNGIPTRTTVRLELDQSKWPSFVNETLDNSFPVGYVGTGKLFNNNYIVTWISQHYGTTNDGLKIKLQVFYPEACPDSYLNYHAEHYSVEFRNAVLVAAGSV